MNRDSFFVTGGAMLADAGSYVARSADAELLKALQAGEFAYVLTTRQMGKTSLTVRTAARLRDDGWSVVVLDLTAFGQNLDVEQWYFSMLSDVGAKLRLEDEMEAYWEANLRRAPLHRFMGAIRECYLERKRKPLAIFVDEIDVVRSLQRFRADEFFAGIRECFNRRSEDPKFSRLTFCLLGVATPSDLISDQRMTPFNIGRGIELADFTPDEAAVLAAGLSPHQATAATLLERALYWTGGHPYLTQRLCAEVQKEAINQPSAVDAICNRIFLSADARNRDENLQFVRERLLRRDLDCAALLDTYAKVCRGERVVEDDHNTVHNELRLAGVVRVKDGCLGPRNRIYTRVFDLKWVRENLPDAEARRQRAAYWRGVRRVGGAAVAILVVMGALVVQTKRSADAARLASENAQEASEREQASAEREKLAAELARSAADGEKKAAEQARAAAETARVAAVGERNANEERLRQAERTEAALKRLADTQTKVAALLAELTRIVGQSGVNSVLDRAEELVAGLSTGPQDDPRIRIGLASLRRICGRLYLRLSNEAKALEQTEAARRIVEEELRRKPEKEQSNWAADTDALNKLLYDCRILEGDIRLGSRTPEVVRRKSREDYEGALKVYDTAVQLARTQLAANPEDAKWRELYFSGLMTMGETAALYNANDEAQKRFGDALAEVKAMREKFSKAPELDRLEASFHDRLGGLYLAHDKRDKAREEFDHALQLREAGTADGADDPERSSDIAFSYNKLGILALDANDTPGALAYFQRSLEIRQKLYDQNPRLDWARNLSLTLANTAQALWVVGQNQKALQLDADRLKLAEDLWNQEPSDANLGSDYANALFNYADILLNVKEPALQDWPKALDLARDAVKRTARRNPRLLVLLAQALRLNHLAGEAHAAATEAGLLLPPEDKRTDRDKETAKDIAYELAKSRNAPARPVPTPRHGRK